MGARYEVATGRSVTCLNAQAPISPYATEAIARSQILSLIRPSNR